jgi:hypothetical protein
MPTNGNNLIYRYIQHTLLADNNLDRFSKELVEHLIIDLSIWLPKTVYDQMPVLLPYVVRDNACRNRDPNLDRWGQCNANGYLRDDNSLIKDIKRSLIVYSIRIPYYHNNSLGTGFVASHIWRNLINNEQALAAQFGRTNSFVPNLVWLPTQISRLTDRENSYAQKLLKFISRKIYFTYNASVFKRSIWDYLDEPEVVLPERFNINQLNYFIVDDNWINRKRERLINSINIINKLIASGTHQGERVGPRAYLTTFLENTDEISRNVFKEWLNDNLQELQNCR